MSNAALGAMGMQQKTGPERVIPFRPDILLLRNGRAGVLEDQGDEQAQEDACKACYHPEASSADQFAGDEQPAQGQNRSKDRNGGGNDPHNIPAFGGEHQKQHKNKSISQKKLGHKLLQRAIPIFLTHFYPSNGLFLGVSYHTLSEIAIVLIQIVYFFILCLRSREKGGIIPKTYIN